MPKIELDREIDLEEVLRFATEKHKGQKRDDGRDYITHPIRVAKIVEKFKAGTSINKNVLIAGALLHDTLEDTYTSYKELCDKFGEVVGSLVLELTNADYCCKLVGKALYLAEKMQYMTNYALFIKLADRYDNICDLNTKPEKKIRTIKDTYYILDYLEKHRSMTKSQLKLVSAIKEKLEEYKLEEISKKTEKK